jgi:hypothetical protein
LVDDYRTTSNYDILIPVSGGKDSYDLGGMYSLNDFVEFTAKHRLDHALRGYEWHDFTDDGRTKLGRPELSEGLSPKDLLWAQYPSDEEIADIGRTEEKIVSSKP